jgi:hypothetical protein
MPQRLPLTVFLVIEAGLIVLAIAVAAVAERVAG